MKSPFLVLKKDCGEAVRWICERLSQSGMQVMQTFDLRAARLDCELCSCPHHGTDQCDCQLVVLLVYENGFPPVSLVAHGHDGQTWFILPDSPSQGSNPRLGSEIQDVLAPHIFTLKLEELSHAA